MSMSSRSRVGRLFLIVSHIASLSLSRENNGIPTAELAAVKIDLTNGIPLKWQRVRFERSQYVRMYAGMSISRRPSTMASKPPVLAPPMRSK